ncbi:MAG TPA: 5-oxoprolinase subunit PxpB [Flavobacteriaceae bacterium]|nr:5-oxoprolinase subunit PxpB [Flavobacteriaceae bacterium]
MKPSNPQFISYGEYAILVQWEKIIDEKLLWFILAAKEKIKENKGKAIVEVIHTFNSLLVKYDEPIKNIYDEILMFSELFSSMDIPKNKPVKRFSLPVCYDEKFALDLKVFAREKKLCPEEIISLHSSKIYTLYFMGFLPGFLYLGTLPKSLRLPRKKQPRKRIEKGAVGIAENQTGIYPKSSPGGWQIIGNCPVDLFQPNYLPPSIFSPGDQIEFYPVSLEEHGFISEEVKKEKFQHRMEIIE